MFRSRLLPAMLSCAALFPLLAGCDGVTQDLGTNTKSEEPPRPPSGNEDGGLSGPQDASTADGTAAVGSCDDGIDIASNDAGDAAKAVGLCKVAGSQADWGLVGARLVLPDGAPLADTLSVGLLPTFGVQKPREGKTMLSLSTGRARAVGQPDYLEGDSEVKGYSHGMPAGFPKTTLANCPNVVPSNKAQDGAALELVIRVPPTAHSLSFLQNIFSHDYPTQVCSPDADVYAAIMTPAPPGLPDGNVAIDDKGDPIGMSSSSFVRSCHPGVSDGLSFACPDGTSGLQGTGFGWAAATGWLETTVPVEPGSEITLLFAIWDAGDGNFDSTVLIDGLTFHAETVSGVSTKPKY